MPRNVCDKYPCTSRTVNEVMVIWQAAGGPATEWLTRCNTHALEIWNDRRLDQIEVSVEGPAAALIRKRGKRVRRAR